MFSNRELLKTGLFPWDKTAVHWEKLTAGTLYTDKTPQVEVAEVIEVTHEVAEIMEDAADVTDRATAVDDAHGSVSPLFQDVGPGADGGVPMEWAQDVQDPLSLPDGPVGLGVVNTRQTPEVFVPPAQVEDQDNIVATGVDIGNFVPEDGTNLVDIFPESNHEEKVHLLQR